MSVTTVHQRIRRDAAWLLAGYAITAGSGFLFWIVAAVMIPSSELGHDAAVISIFSAAAAFSSTGVASALVVMLPPSGQAAQTLWRHARRMILLLSIGAGVIAGLLVSRFELASAPAIPTVVAITGATVIWAMFNTQTQVLTGLGDVPMTLWVNGPTNVAKLIATALISGVLAAYHPVVLATLAPAAVAVAVTLGYLIPRAMRRHLAEAEPVSWDREFRRRFDHFAAVNTAAIGVVLAVNLSIGFFVTVLSSPSQGALFAIAFQFGVALDLIAVGAATSLAKHRAGATVDREIVTHLWRRVAGQVAIAGVAAVGLVVAMFTFLGGDYQPATGATLVAMLATASGLRAVYDLWAAAMRAQHRVAPVLVGNLGGAAVVAVLTVVLVPHGGALGGAAAVLCGAAVVGVAGALGVSRLPLAGGLR